ncbi:16S rRNA (adenine(1518)-N(6)/adenine(1519)-N(6))-dimethyltransferase RsmA [Flavobacteriales bacterium]|nr:16S rRNA (adenine(1518)-N(6)/adenine(1519)-N(6))-dimethyltransferase RsmA [Flavobacteriales bacterium]
MIPFKPKKKFGQNFLINKNLSTKIASYINVKNCHSLIEIGPGLGSLTKEIINIDIDEKKFIEIDRDCVDYLQKSITEINGNIINEDFLKIDLNIFKSPMVIVGNFPYNISNQILFKIYENRDIVQSMVGMFQFEVAERICSSKGSKKYGILSVLIQAYFDVEMKIKIRPNNFYPAPKIDSAVIKIVKNRDHLNCDEKLFKEVVKTTFNLRRKKIRNSLKTLNYSQIKFDNPIFDKRPEELGVLEFINLTNLLNNENI